MKWVLQTARTFLFLQKLRRNVHLSPEVFRSIQDKLLRNMVAHAYQKVPFYKRFWEEAGFNASGFRGVDDLEKIPIFSSDILDRYGGQRELLQQGIDIFQCTFLDTTGTSGRFLRIWKRPHEERVRQAVGLRIWLEHGFRWHFSTVDFQRAEGPKHFLQRFGIAPKTWILCDVPISEQIQRFLTTKADVVVGTATALRRICYRLEEMGVHPKQPHIVFCAGELPDNETCDLVRRVLSCEVFGIYGQSEVGYVAWQCERREGFHINADTHLVEVLRDGKPAAAGQLGHIVLTDLYAKTMPFIRYDTGDLAVQTNNPCPCGRGLPILGSIEGRKNGSVRCPDGRLITTRDIVNHMGKVLRLGEYRILQEEGVVRLQIVSKNPHLIESGTLQSFSTHLNTLLAGIPIKVELVEPWLSDQAWKTHTVLSISAAREGVLLNT